MLLCLHIFGKKSESAAVILYLGHGLSIPDRENLEGAVSSLFLMLFVLPSAIGVKSWGADSPGHGNGVWWTEHWAGGLGLPGRTGHHFLVANRSIPLLLGKMKLCKACSLKNVNAQVPQLSTCWNILCPSKSCQFSLASSNMCLWSLLPPRYIPVHIIHGNREHRAPPRSWVWLRLPAWQSDWWISVEMSRLWALQAFHSIPRARVLLKWRPGVGYTCRLIAPAPWDVTLYWKLCLRSNWLTAKHMGKNGRDWCFAVL